MAISPQEYQNQFDVALVNKIESLIDAQLLGEPKGNSPVNINPSVMYADLDNVYPDNFVLRELVRRYRAAGWDLVSIEHKGNGRFEADHLWVHLTMIDE